MWVTSNTSKKWPFTSPAVTLSVKFCSSVSATAERFTGIECFRKWHFQEENITRVPCLQHLSDLAAARSTAFKFLEIENGSWEIPPLGSHWASHDHDYLYSGEGSAEGIYILLFITTSLSFVCLFTACYFWSPLSFAKSEVQAQRNLFLNFHRNIDKKTSGLAFDSHENDKITWKIPLFSMIPASNTQYPCCQILHFLPKLRLTSIILLGII